MTDSLKKVVDSLKELDLSELDHQEINVLITALNRELDELASFLESKNTKKGVS